MANLRSVGQALARLSRSGPRAWAIVTLLNACLVGVVVIALRWPPAGAVRIVAATAEAIDTVSVLVGGAVRSPGAYDLPAAATVGDALAAAGGVLAAADAATLDPERALVDGEQVWVATSGEAIDGAGALLDINSAPAADLEVLPGIGPTLAARIVAYRDEHGAFSAVEELLNITGIGQKTLEALRPRVEVR